MARLPAVGGVPHDRVVRRPADAALAARVGGHCPCAGLIEVEVDIALGSPWGRAALDGRLNDALAFFTGDAGADAATTVFMDTETTGLSGGAGTVVLMLGIGRFRRSGLHIVQTFLTGFTAEARLLERAERLLADARTLVTYNGKSFDAPLLEARYRAHGRASPFARLRHLDLLHLTRRAFHGRWPDCRLRTAEERLLGLIREGDLPSAAVPDTWYRWVQHGESGRLPALFRHNRHDLVTLAALPRHLLRAYREPAASGARDLAGERCPGARSDGDRAHAHPPRGRAALDEDGLLQLAQLARRRGERQRTTAVWRTLASAGNTGAVEHLAKYHEHVLGDLESALELTRTLLRAEPQLEHHRRRERRLLDKLCRA